MYIHSLSLSLHYIYIYRYVHSRGRVTASSPRSEVHTEAHIASNVLCPFSASERCVLAASAFCTLFFWLEVAREYTYTSARTSLRQPFAHVTILRVADVLATSDRIDDLRARCRHASSPKPRAPHPEPQSLSHPKKFSGRENSGSRPPGKAAGGGAAGGGAAAAVGGGAAGDPAGCAAGGAAQPDHSRARRSRARPRSWTERSSGASVPSLRRTLPDAPRGIRALIIQRKKRRGGRAFGSVSVAVSAPLPILARSVGYRVIVISTWYRCQYRVLALTPLCWLRQHRRAFRAG